MCTGLVTLTQTLDISVANGAEERIRTSDPRITNALLYQLSYFGSGASIALRRPSGQRRHLAIKVFACPARG